MTINQPVAFAHVDVDWYEPVMTCLSRVFPSLVIGGSIILDDYHDWGGCRKATDEFLRKIPGQFIRWLRRFNKNNENKKLTMFKPDWPAHMIVQALIWDDRDFF